MTKETIGARIKARRNHLRLAQHDVAELLAAKGIEISGTQIGHYEAGRNEPKITTLVAIADVLNCDVNYFLQQEAAQPLESDLATLGDINRLEKLIMSVRESVAKYETSSQKP